MPTIVHVPVSGEDQTWSLILVGVGVGVPTLGKDRNGLSCPLVFVFLLRTTHGHSCALVFMFRFPMRTAHDWSHPVMF